jgi:sterol desaturase/sphingolipid hydroxylase (fatty acid hydroxylase superfamily)
VSKIDNYIGTVISIFTGLFFSLLLSIGDKIRNEKFNPNRDNDNFQKYKENMKQISNIVLYIILFGVEIFILLFLNSILGKYANGYVEIIITLLVSYLLARFVVSLLFVIQRFYYTSRDEINNIL